MMHEYLILTETPGIYDPPSCHAAVVTGIYGEVPVVTVLHTENPTAEDDSLIGAWNIDGEQVEHVDLDLYRGIRPLGNEPSRPVYDEDGNEIGLTRGGDATKQLLYSYWDGWKQRQLGDAGADDHVARMYPAEDQPFHIVVGHHWYEQAEFSGWGFLAEIHGGDQARDPGVHSLGIYSDPDCENYLWTPGAAVQMESRLGKVDEAGNPAMVYGWETPAGQRTAEKQSWHLAVLEASLQKGYATMNKLQDRIEFLFWEKTQGDDGGNYVGSGITVDSIIGGGVLGVSSSEGFIVGETLKIGDAETVFVRVHSPGIIVVDLHVADSVGHEIFWIR